MIAGHCTYGARMLNDAIGIVADQIAALDRAISAAKQLPVHPVRKPPSRRVFAFLRLTQLHALARFPQTMHSPAPSLFAGSRRTRVGVFDSRLALIRAAVLRFRPSSSDSSSYSFRFAPKTTFYELLIFSCA